jgi:hypothetical protein
LFDEAHPSRKEKHLLASDEISKRRLPADMKDRDRFVGVRVVRSGRKGQYFQARFSIPNTLLFEVGKPKRVSIRGTPQNGYIISAGDDLKLMILDNSSVAYLNVSAERVNMPRDERAVIWVRGQIEKNIVRIPPLPPVWISGQGEFMPPKTGGERMAVDRMSDDEPVRAAASASRPVNDGNGHDGNRGVSITSPLPKKASEYQLPEGTSLDEAQGLLARKLEEARVIIRELEKRTGLRLTLSRNFQIVVDLSSR